MAKRRTIGQIPSALRDSLAAAAAGEAPWPLTLVGDVGTGKTCAALVLCDHVPDSQYETFRGLCETLRLAQEGKLEWYSQGSGGKILTCRVWSSLQAAPLVVLDEIGAREKVSDFQYECLYELLEQREGQPTVLISNLPLVDLARVFDDRIVSRLIAGTVVSLEGEDRRDPRSARS